MDALARPGVTCLVRFAVAAALYGAITPLHAQEDEELEQVVVTGSHIRRADMEKTVPVSVIDEAAMETRNAVLPSELLTSLPSVVSLPQNETRLGSSGARGDNANLNMRGLGATATLILVDGRRMAVNPMVAGVDQAVNINQLPRHGVERIEVLRDGASSIYGSDAVGGVINYVLKRDMEGAEASLRYDQPEAGGGESLQGGLAFGTKFAGGRGRLVGTLDVLGRKQIWMSERDYAASSLDIMAKAEEPWRAPGGAFDNRQARGEWPTFTVAGLSGTYRFRPVNGTPALTNAAVSLANTPDFYLDYNQFSYAAPKVRRGDAFLSAEFDLTDSITAFGDVSYYTAKSTMRRQPLVLNAPGTDKAIVLSVDNPYNPYGSRFYAPGGDGVTRLAGTPRAVSLTQGVIADVAPEVIVTDNDALRLVAGLRGGFGDTSWKWESSLFYNEVNGQDDGSPDVRESLLQAAAARTDANAYNPFHYTFHIVNGAVVADQPYTNPQSVLDSFTEVYSRTAKSYIASGDARANGTLFSWWGGDLQAAIGTEYRKEYLRDTRPLFDGSNPPDSGLAVDDNDFLLHPGRPDVFGDRKVFSAYAELVAPLVPESARLPGVYSLELSASGRFEHYSDFGSTTKPKIGINWRPVQWLMLRGSYNEGFMAPTLPALYLSQRWSPTTGGILDPYRNPYTAEGRYTDRYITGGNPDMQPTESEGITFGFVLDVPGVEGLSVTADYWKITRTNMVGTRSESVILDNDAALLRAYTAAQLATGANPNSIDLGSGTDHYVGDPDVIRLALTDEDRAAFAAWNAAHPNDLAAPAGRIFSHAQLTRNFNSSEHRGVDMGFRYVLPRFPWGRVVLNSEASWLWRARTADLSSGTTVVSNGLYAGGAAKWRSTHYISWDRGAWDANLGIYHVGKTLDSPTVTAAQYESLGRPGYVMPYYPTVGGNPIYRRVIDPVVSYNLSVGYRFKPEASSWLGDTRVRLTIANLTDKDPPLAAGGLGYDPATGQSLLPGRTWSFEITSKF
jgi:outer membrane receptor protein involved in Fe transport